MVHNIITLCAYVFCFYIRQFKASVTAQNWWICVILVFPLFTYCLFILSVYLKSGPCATIFRFLYWDMERERAVGQSDGGNYKRVNWGDREERMRERMKDGRVISLSWPVRLQLNEWNVFWGLIHSVILAAMSLWHWRRWRRKQISRELSRCCLAASNAQFIVGSKTGSLSKYWM